MNDSGEARPVSRAGRWWWQVWRVAVGLAPRWDGRSAGAWGVVLVAAAAVALSVGLERLMLAGAAQFYPQAWGTGWVGTLLTVAACGLAARQRVAADRPDGATLFAWLLMVNVVVLALSGGWFVALVRGWIPAASVRDAGPWVYFGAVAWNALAGAVLLCRQVRQPAVGVATVALLALAAAATVYLPRGNAWYPEAPANAAADEDPGPARPVLTQERLESQSRVLVEALDGVAPQRPGVVELYAITFAPYADEDVFTRETAMVSGVMRERFDAAGRVVELQNHASTVGEAPWATPLNLQRAIARMGERMDVREDVLFLHLTSHGGRDGRLAAGFEPIDVDAVTPQQLRTWLDDAGIRHAVVSVSACYSGSWIEPLAAPGTLVMTAADATHTSYGCGRLSPLTFFGRAVYDEQLRTSRSFEAAFAAALPVIDRREREAGKSDGPSNPQIRIGAEIRPTLDALVRRLEAAP